MCVGVRVRVTVCNLCVFVDIALAVLMMCINQSCTETVTAQRSELESEREGERERKREVTLQAFARLLTHALRNSCNDVMSIVDAA